MAQTITASVGKGGVNRRDDVITIQELLNKVPPEKGGPDPKLDVDGYAWSKTIGAIIKFQRIACGFQAPDGRVDPGQRTLQKLNEFDAADVVSTRFRLRRFYDPKYIFDSDLAQPYLWYFEVEDQQNSRTAIYWFGNPPGPGTYGGEPFRGEWSELSPLGQPVAITGLTCDAWYTSYSVPQIAPFSFLRLWHPSGMSSAAMRSHLFLKGYPKPHGVTGEHRGRFILIQ